MSSVDFSAASGKGVLVGAGPGDLESVTLKAVRALRDAGGRA